MAAFFAGNLLNGIPVPTPAERAEAERLAALAARLQIWQNATREPAGDTSWLSLAEFCVLNRELQDGLGRLDPRALAGSRIAEYAGALADNAQVGLDLLTEGQRPS